MEADLGEEVPHDVSAVEAGDLGHGVGEAGRWPWTAGPSVVMSHVELSSWLA